MAELVPGAGRRTDRRRRAGGAFGTPVRDVALHLSVALVILLVLGRLWVEAVRAKGGAIPASLSLKPSAVLLVKPGIIAAVALEGFAGMVLARRGLPPPGTVFLGLACLLGGGGRFRHPERRPGRGDGREDAPALPPDRGAPFPGARARRGVRRRRHRGILHRVGARPQQVVFLLLAAAAVGYAVLYTMVWKRRSPYGTIPGAVPGALPVLIGYAAVNPGLGVDGLILFLFLLLWQPPHFWALALKYREEYRAAGVPVLPVAFGEPYTKVLIFLYAAALSPLSVSLWALGGLSPFFGWASILLGAAFLAAYLRRHGRHAPLRARVRRLDRLPALVLLALLADVLFR